ncbi:hypothetical protein ACP4OV_027766 [Aristida adscensionis]
MVSRQKSITGYRNRRSGQQESGSSAASDAHLRRDTSPVCDLHMSPPRQRASRDHHDLPRGAGSQRRRTVPSRADTISAYHTQQTEQLQTVEEGPNDTPDADEDQTSQLPSEEADIMPSPNHRPSHACICRTRPEDVKFGRGVLKGLKAAKKHYDNGFEKLQIQFSTRLGGPIGVNYQTFVQEVVTFIKKRAPLMHARKWSHARGYMAKPHTVSKSLHAQMDEQARATIETQRQNGELTCHVQHLEDKNEELQLQVQDVEEQNKELHAEVKDLENKIETDRTVRAKEIEDLKQSLRDEMLQMIGNQAAATQQPSQDKQYESSSNRTTVKHTLSQDQSSKQIPSACIINSHHLRQTAKSRCHQ